MRAEEDRIRQWRSRIGDHGFKIGISWQGAIDARADIMRSFPLAVFDGLSRIEGVRLISLQKGETASAAALAAANIPVEMLGPDFDDGPDAFIDTAAAMESLDLVVSCDTSVAHLAGATRQAGLGRLEKSAGMAMAAGLHGYSLVPDDAALSAGQARRLGRSVRTHRAGCRSNPARAARRLGGAGGSSCFAGELTDKLTILEIEPERR